jgi:hypothetical protein
MEDKMRIVRTNQPKETYIAGSDRPETGSRSTSVDSSADSDQFDPNRDLQASERSTRPELKSNEKWHPDLSGIYRSRSVNAPELRELLEAAYGLTDHKFQSRQDRRRGDRLEAKFTSNPKRQDSSVELLEGSTHFMAADVATGAEMKSAVDSTDK